MQVLRVMLVDDDAELRGSLTAWLGGLTGVQVVAEAGCADEAIAVLKRITPHLVLTDVDMPGMDGFERAKYIRDKDAAPRVVVMSATDSADYPEFSNLAGADTFIFKPRLRARLAEYFVKQFGMPALQA